MRSSQSLHPIPFQQQRQIRREDSQNLTPLRKKHKKSQHNSTRVSRDNSVNEGTFDLTMTGSSQHNRISQISTEIFRQQRFELVKKEKYKLRQRQSQLLQVIEPSNQVDNLNLTAPFIKQFPIRIVQKRVNKFRNLSNNSKQENEKEDEEEEDLEIQKKLCETIYPRMNDKVAMKPRGKKSVDNFYNHYKHLDKVIQQNHFYNIKNTYATSMLQLSEKKALLPAKLGIIKLDKIDRESLNIYGNRLGDFALKDLMEQIIRNQNLRVLDLSNNLLSDGISEQIGLIIYKSSIYELYLHWNQFRANCGNAIFSALSENNCLKVLDLSCNSLGNGGTCKYKISDFMEKNVEMRHLDLSHNYFDKEDSLQIASSLEKNKTIYGFHFTGNCGYVDSRGFLVVQENQAVLSGLHNKRQIKGVKVQERELFRLECDFDLPDCCWICDGWQEIQFRWNIGPSGEYDRDPLFIHFNFENFRCNYFGKSDDNSEGYFSYKRMVPPGALKFFFSNDQTEMAADDQPKSIVQEEKIIKNVSLFNGTSRDIFIEQLNFRLIPKNTSVFTKYYEPTISIEPRHKDPVYVPPKKKKIKIKWTFPISLMAKWCKDDEDLIQKCFEFDWEYCKIPRIIKNKPQDLQQVKEFLSQNYKYIKDTYKYYASFNPVGDIWAIQKLQFTDLIDQTNVVDGKNLKEADVDIKWTSTTSGGDKGNYRNPERGINRYQVMEVLVRIAEEKYILKSKKPITYFDAFKTMWDELLEKEFKSHNTQEWRETRYWNEECDYCLKNYKPIIEHIYKRFSKKKVKPGICSISGLQNDDKFGSNVTNFAFNLSMMTQVDEQTLDRIFQMTIVEFYESLARIAEEANLPPLPGIPNVVVNPSELTYEQRKNLHLGYKLEALIVRLLKTCTDPGFRVSYGSVERSFFYVPPKNQDSKDDGEDSEIDIV